MALLPLAKQILGINIAIATLVIVVVCLRLLARRKGHIQLAADDIVMIVALFIAVASCAVDIWGAAVGIQGPEVLSMSPSDLSQFKKLLFLDVILAVICFGLVKVSILLFYRHLFPTWEVKLAVDVTFVVVLLWTLAGLLVNIFRFESVQRWWISPPGYNPMTQGPSPERFNYALANLILSCINTLLDLIVLTLPLPVIHRLKVSGPKKISLVLVFSAGAVCVIASVIRATWAYRLYEMCTFRITIWRTTEILNYNVLWAHIEIGFSIIVACLPTLASLDAYFISLFNKLSSLMNRCKPRRNVDLPSYKSQRSLSKSTLQFEKRRNRSGRNSISPSPSEKRLLSVTPTAQASAKYSSQAGQTNQPATPYIDASKYAYKNTPIRNYGHEEEFDRENKYEYGHTRNYLNGPFTTPIQTVQSRWSTTKSEVVSPVSSFSSFRSSLVLGPNKASSRRAGKTWRKDRRHAGNNDKWTNGDTSADTGISNTHSEYEEVREGSPIHSSPLLPSPPRCARTEDVGTFLSPPSSSSSLTIPTSTFRSSVNPSFSQKLTPRPDCKPDRFSADKNIYVTTTYEYRYEPCNETDVSEMHDNDNDDNQTSDNSDGAATAPAIGLGIDPGPSLSPDGGFHHRYNHLHFHHHNRNHKQLVHQSSRPNTPSAPASTYGSTCPSPPSIARSPVPALPVASAKSLQTTTTAATRFNTTPSLSTRSFPWHNREETREMDLEQGRGRKPGFPYRHHMAGGTG